MLLVLRTPGRTDEVAAIRNVGEAPVRQRRRTAVTKRAQPRAVVSTDVRAKLHEAICAVGTDAVQMRFDLAAIKEVIRADEGDPAIGHYLRLVVEDRRGGDEMNVAAIG